MTRAIQVCLGETAIPVGILRYDQDGPRESASFE